MFGFELSDIWAALIAFAVLTYVCLDGFDLGVGILFPLSESEDDRAQMMSSVVPVWDGNETWLVLGGGGLFAVFPLAYSIVMPALYIPIIGMLLGLVFRGVAFEFRWRTDRWRGFWDGAFWLGSTFAALMQGMVIGALVQGIAVTDRSYSGGTFDWLTPFSALCGIALVIGYSLLGATWLNLKSGGAIQHRMRRVARGLAWATLAILVLVIILTALRETGYRDRWLTWPVSLYFGALPLLIALAGWLLLRGLFFRREMVPFLAAQSLFVMGYIGIAISFYPNLVPPSLSISAAAAPDNSLQFALYGAIVLIPIILTYTAFSYWIFRGKIDPAQERYR